MNTKQSTIYIFLMVGFVSAIETPTGTYELCKNSPRELDLSRCYLTNQLGNINYMQSYSPFLQGYCNVTFPDVDVYTTGILLRVTYIVVEQAVCQKVELVVNNMNDTAITEEYVPKEQDVVIGFQALCETSFPDSINETGHMFVELIFKDRPGYDGYCIIAKVQVVKKDFNIPTVGG